METAMQFKEIEHKFIVGEGFDLERFRARLLALGPTRTSEVEVDDTYYVPRDRLGVILRHRYDRELQDLTLKSRSGADPEARTEITLKLEHGAGNQQRAVAELLGALLGAGSAARPGASGIAWHGSLHKRLHVFYFPDCEVVHYVATAGERTVRCVEFEARGATDLDTARATLKRYEELTGFAEQPRSKRSLFDLLLRAQIPDGLIAD